MILNILSILLFLIFLILSCIHFYWAFGGKWAIRNAIPTKIENVNLNFRPSAIATLVVGIILMFFSYFYLNQTNFATDKLPYWNNILLWILPFLFFLRIIGDFKYVGVFKSIKSTLFAKWDTKLYIPLCFIISLSGFLILALS